MANLAKGRSVRDQRSGSQNTGFGQQQVQQHQEDDDQVIVVQGGTGRHSGNII